MTTYNKNTLKTFFETNDIPTGQNFADFIDSNVNLVETARQDMAGPLYTTELATANVSADDVVAKNRLYALGETYFSGNMTADAPGNTIVGQDFVTTGDVFTTNISLLNGSIVSARGSAQATAAVVSASICRLTGVVDGQTTGFRLVSAAGGRIQYVTNITNVSANLWPAIGQAINGNAANQVFPLAGNTTYTIIHTSTSSYGVK